MYRNLNWKFGFRIMGVSDSRYLQGEAENGHEGNNARDKVGSLAADTGALVLAVAAAATLGLAGAVGGDTVLAGRSRISGPLGTITLKTGTLAGTLLEVLQQRHVSKLHHAIL